MATGAALWDYVAQTESELSFQAGSIIEIVQPDEGGWTLGKLFDKEGWFPSSYLQPLDVSATIYNIFFFSLLTMTIP
jgi:hypothetical protein